MFTRVCACRFEAVQLFVRTAQTVMRGKASFFEVTSERFTARGNSGGQGLDEI